MVKYEYKVVPAPRKGKRDKAAKNGGERFATALMDVMNALGAEGWEYLRSDTLPSEERTGLTGKTTVYQNMLVFRRELEAGQPQAGEPDPFDPDDEDDDEPEAEAPGEEGLAAQ